MQYQEVVLWVYTFPTHLDPPHHHHIISWLKGMGGKGSICVVCTNVHLHRSASRYMYMNLRRHIKTIASWFLGAVGAVHLCYV